MIPREPIDGPSVESECCDVGGCREPWAAEVNEQNGPRKLRLCEEHHDARRTSAAPFYGLARTFVVGARRAG
jgi:hypothetical protein